MTALEWDLVSERFYETGVDHGVLYPQSGAGDYPDGFAWNGLTTVTESPSGAEANPQYADNIKYLNLYSAEEFGGTIEAFTYPAEFAECDGTAVPSPGVSVGQQNRKAFGLAYRSRLGNDVDGTDHGYKLHLVYGATASPSEKAYATINDSPESITFSWDFATVPVAWSGGKPTSLIVIDSTEVDAAALATLEGILFGDADSDARLPLPNEVVDLLGGAVTTVDMDLAANQPTFANATGVVTLPAVAGVQWKVNGANRAPGAQPAIAVGQTAEVEATPTAGNTLDGDTDWAFERV
jgi:hypothetical protein